MGAVSTDTLSRPVQIPCPLHEQCSRFRLGSPVVPPKNLREITTPDWVGSNPNPPNRLRFQLKKLSSKSEAEK